MRQISVLVVDDSVVVRRLVTAALEEATDIHVVATASDGVIALEKLRTLSPDAVTLDIEMPNMDGLTTLREIRKLYPRLPVIMFSTLTERAGHATLEALSAGASDYVTKPANVGSVAESLRAVRDQLVPKLRALCPQPHVHAALPATTPRPSATPAGRASVPAAGRPAARPARRSGGVAIVAVGCSTGGPEALGSVLPKLPASFSVPIVVVQHMPKLFTRLFAERLGRSCPLTVVEAQGGETLRPGTVYIAPGERHLVVERRAGGIVTRLVDTPPENFCRPSVDVLFRSVAATYGASSLAVVLTGMGADGRAGAGDLRAAGAHVVVQDRETSVVWGMPGAVAGAGLADDILGLPSIAPYLVQAVAPARVVLSAGAAR